MDDDLREKREELLLSAELMEKGIFFKNIKRRQKEEALKFLNEFSEEITAEDINKKRPEI